MEVSAVIVRPIELKDAEEFVRELSKKFDESNFMVFEH